MNESENTPIATVEESVVADNAGRTDSSVEVTAVQQTDRQQERAWQWWSKLIVQPLLFLVFGGVLIAGLGVAQGLGWISAGGGGDGESHSHGSSGDENVRYICPMMCTPPQSEPGRCPVCAMELVPATSGGGNTDSRSIQMDPSARRVANIRTVAVKLMPMSRAIRTIGELRCDEGTLKTIAAYVDGRLDRLYADYTGIVVGKGDHLALVYSPRLYSSQVELLLSKKARDGSRSRTLKRVIRSKNSLYQSAKQRLIEFGMTEQQIEQLEKNGRANSRMHLCAPISGTVIEKLAVEGQYVKEGQAIYKLADLSTVWLMLELFPEDAAMIRYGQKVEAEVQSLPNRTFSGRVAFIDPMVEPKTRTVGVRVVIANEEGLLRIGDYAKATINVPLAGSTDHLAQVYDAELANKWIGPRHPHVIESSPGKCRVCGVDLVPASQFGFTAEASINDEVLVVPRDAVLLVGDSSVLYVETDPGRFELRRVTLGPSCDNEMVILSGVEQGEQVATRGNFLIDSQMQLVGNPSLIDPTKAEPKMDEAQEAEMIAALTKLPEEDRILAEQQRICPVTDLPLGSMGAPLKVDVNGTPVFICCEGCREGLLEEPKMYLAKLKEGASAKGSRKSAPQDDVPSIGDLQMTELQDDSPQMEVSLETEDNSSEGGYSHAIPIKRATKQRKEVTR